MKKMEGWFKRQMEKIELFIKDLQQNPLCEIKFSNIYNKINKYKNSMPWKAFISNENFSIATTPFSNYSVFSSNSINKSHENSKSNLNNAFYLFSNHKTSESNEFFKKTPKKSNENFQIKEVMSMSEKEELLLKLVNNANINENDAFSRHSVKLEDILNVTKNSHSNSSNGCEFLKGVSHKKKNSLEKLLKTINFTTKFVENPQNNSNNLQSSGENCQSIVKNLNRDVYQHLGDTLSFSHSMNNSSNLFRPSVLNNKLLTFKTNTNLNDKKKVPPLNLEKITKIIENTHSCSPSYRKKAERSQYLREIFQEKKQEKEERKIVIKKNNKPNKSMDFSNKPLNLSYFRTKINEKTNNFIHNIFKTHKNNYSLIEGSKKDKDESFHQRANLKINDIMQKKKTNEIEPPLALRDNTNYLNIVAPTNNINFFIAGDFDEKDASTSNNSQRPQKNNRLMKLLSQVNQNRKEGKSLKENLKIHDFSFKNIIGVLKDKGKTPEEFTFLSKQKKTDNFK